MYHQNGHNRVDILERVLSGEGGFGQFWVKSNFSPNDWSSLAFLRFGRNQDMRNSLKVSLFAQYYEQEPNDKAQMCRFYK